MKGTAVAGVVFAIAWVSSITWALEDTPANRGREADRLISRDQIQEGLQNALDHMSEIFPMAVRKDFKDRMTVNIDISALETVMKEGMIKRFTADEMKALADADPSSVSEALKKKSEDYALEMLQTFSQAIDAALAKVSPEIVKWVAGDGRLGVRVRDLYSAIASNDLGKRYKMESVAVRHKMTFEGWKRDLGLDKPQREPTVKIVQGELDKVLGCKPWAYEDGQETLRCRLLVRVTIEGNGGDRKAHRLLEMWESVNGEWYHGITDHHGWQDPPK